MRPTMPSSALNTPHWQVNDEATRMKVLTEENGTLSIAVDWVHRSSLTALIVK